MATIKISDQLLTSFNRNNPNFKIIEFNLSDKAEVDKLDWEDLNRETILDRLKAYQRLLRINPNPDIAKKLLNTSVQSESSIQSRSREESGVSLDSAHAIASRTEEQFVKMLPGDEEVARQMHKKTIDIKVKTQLLWANMKDAIAYPHFRAMRLM